MHKNRLIVALILLSSCFLSNGNTYLYAQTDQEIQDHVIVGCRFLMREELDKAIAEFDTAISLIKQEKPDYCLAYYNRARAWERKQELNKAFSDYTQAIRFDPRYLLAYYGRAYVMRKKGQLDTAILEYDRILGIDKNQPHAYNNRGICYYEKGELSLAMSDFNKAIELDDKLLNAHYNRGVLKVHNREYYEASFDFQKELRIYPNSLKPKYYERAVCAFYNKRIIIFFSHPIWLWLSFCTLNMSSFQILFYSNNLQSHNSHLSFSFQYISFVLDSLNLNNPCLSL